MAKREPSKAPDFIIKTPCGSGQVSVRWREIGEAYWQESDGVKYLSCRIDLPPQAGRVVMFPFSDRNIKIEDDK